MKRIQYILSGVIALMMASCMDSGYGDVNTSAENSYGNNSITESNVVTIKELCAMENYKTVMTQYRDFKEVTDDIQLKVRVTGNDQGGNIYNKVALQDENGDAIIVCVYAGGMHAYLQVGQQILINLKGLYVGTYGYQKQIGVPYTTASGNTYPGRMSNAMWQEHFKLIGKPDPSVANVQPIEFTTTIMDNIDEHAGKLMTIKGVTLVDANGTTVWAPSGTNVTEDEANTDFSIERTMQGYSASKVVVYTSTSAKFANEVIPTGKVNITGIFTRYNKKYQLQMRTIDDIVAVE